MAFGRGKDVKKSSYYVWFLGAKEATGLRGEEYILPVLHKLLDQEKHFEPSKVTLQVSNKGIKIIQNVPKKKANSKAISMAHLPSSVSNQFNYNASSRHCTINSSASSSSSTNSLGGGGFIGGPSGDHHHHHHHGGRPSHNQSVMSPSSGVLGSSGYLPPGCKMEQIKHLIPHDSITSVVQEDDIVCCLLLIYNPLTQCPIHVHAYRCDSIETAYSLTEQIQVLIERPENQKKFASIEKKLAMKAIIPSSIAHASMHNSNNYSPSHLPHHLIYAGNNHQQQQQLLPAHHKLLSSSSSSSSPSHRHQHRLLQPHHSSSASCSPARRSHFSSSTGAGSDGRSTRTEGSDELTSTLRDDRSRPSRSLERVNRADMPSTGPLSVKQQQRMINGHVHPSIHPHFIEPDKEQLFESLAHELKVKLGSHKQTGPILLPPRDYDTISRCRGKLDGIEERESTNRHIVGIIAGKKRISKSCKSLNGVSDANDIDEEDEALPDTAGDIDNYAGKPYKSMSNIINGKKVNQSRADDHEQRSPVLSTSKSFASSGIGSDEALQDSHRSKVTSSASKSYKYSNCSNGTSTESSDSLEEDEKVKPISDSSSWLSRSKGPSKAPASSVAVKDRNSSGNNSNFNKHDMSHHRESNSTSDFISLPPSIAPARSQVKSNFLFGDLPSNLSSQPASSSKVCKVSSSNGSSSHSINAINKPKSTESNAQEKPKFYFPAESSFNSKEVQDKRRLLNRVSPSSKADVPTLTTEDECEFIKKSSELRKNRESKNNQLSVKVTVNGSGTSTANDRSKVYNPSSVSSAQAGSNYLSKKISSLNGVNSMSSPDGKRLTSTSCYGTVILDTNLMKR